MKTNTVKIHIASILIHLNKTVIDKVIYKILVIVLNTKINAKTHNCSNLQPIN